MSKKGLPIGLKMRHDSHYVDELTKSHQFIGRTIKITKIEPNPEQPRVEMGDLGELVASIKEKGVLEPLLVKPLAGLDKWLIIAGERRWRAAQIAGLTDLPCIELNIDEREVAEIALIENLQRKDLTVWEEADAYQSLCDRFQYTHEDLARKLGKSRSSVTETLTVATLPSSVKRKCVDVGINSKAAILKIARKFDEGEMLEELNRYTKQNASEYAGIKSDDNKNLADERKSVLNSGSSNSTSATGSITNVADSDNKGATNFNFPLRIFKLADEKQNFKIEIKFKKPANAEDVKEAVNKIIDAINTQNK